MELFNNFRMSFFVWWWMTKLFLVRIKRKLWNKRLLLWWYRAWIRKNEFHRSLNIDQIAMSVMDTEERKKYLKDLSDRREKAHQNSL